MGLQKVGYDLMTKQQQDKIESSLKNNISKKKWYHFKMFVKGKQITFKEQNFQ